MTQVSIVIPVFNGAQYLSETLERCLLLDQKRVEIIVVDDCSTDDSTTIASRYPFRLLQQHQQRGIATTQNIGVAASSADYITFLDQDDLLLPESIDTRLTWLRSSSDFRVVGGTLGGYIDEKNEPIDSLNKKITPPPLRLSLDHFTTSTYPVGLWAYMFHRSLLNEMGELDENLLVSADREYIYRVLSKEEIPIIDCPTILKRIHTQNASVQRQDGNFGLTRRGAAEAYLVNLQYKVRS